MFGDKGFMKFLGGYIGIVLLVIYLALCTSLMGCVNRTIYYPPVTYHDSRGNERVRSIPAVIEDGDLLGAHEIYVSRSGVRYIASGPLDNSTSTRIIYREVGGMVKAGMGAASVIGAGGMIPKF